MDQEVKNNRLIEELPRQFKPQRTIEEEMNNNRRTIIEILNMVWNSENKETIFTCHGKITKIETGFGWYFMSCEICRRKVKPRGEHLWCDRCNKLAGFPIPRYRIELKVEDDTGLATFILFDSTAEKLLHISAKELK
ncbi:replication protein A 70 kDa DNA-binding subunit B-like isoform X2 [Castanea sativa]|uniref:replication protein A 70 kDa DNA-binding subunit B-like isoform X2 n=1 Tax=Castanea sativa TaxID=21020 RepID=UPI003F650742